MRLKSYKGAGMMLFRNWGGRFEVLLGKRSLKHGYGKWAIPGGKMEKKDNTFFDCAVRELKEETGVDICTINHKVIDSRNISVPYFHWSTFRLLQEPKKMQEPLFPIIGITAIIIVDNRNNKGPTIYTRYSGLLFSWR